VNSHQTSTERRRSERALESLPLVVRGVDLLGQPFEERTTTLAYNSHGCRYTSTHHLPRNSWVTLELPASVTGSTQSDLLRARVAWVQRPHSIRDFFQIAVELETPANVWKGGWGPNAGALSSSFPIAMTEDTADARHEPKLRNAAEDIDVGQGEAGFEPTQYEPLHLGSDSPLIRGLRAELDRQAKEAAASAAEEARNNVMSAVEENERSYSARAEESFGKWKTQLDQVQDQARAEYSAHVSAQQNEFLQNVKTELDAALHQARELVSHLNHQTETLRSASQTAQEKTSQVAQSLLQLEAAEAARAARSAAGQSQEELEAQENLASGWRRRLES
jgi:hypothetical protein